MGWRGPRLACCRAAAPESGARARPSSGAPSPPSSPPPPPPPSPPLPLGRGPRALLPLLLLPPLLLLRTSALAAGAAAPGAVCWWAPRGAGSVRERTQRAAVVIEGQVPRRRPPDQGPALDQAARAAVRGLEEPPATPHSRPGLSPSPRPGGGGDPEAPYLVRVRHVWAVKTGGLSRDALVTVRLGPAPGSASPAPCGDPRPPPPPRRLREDRTYIFFMEPEANGSGGELPAAFKASSPPLPAGRKVRKEVGRLLCERCGKCPGPPTGGHGGLRGRGQ
ncbi:uncharacterized protein [Notamacropus eugenii]|uniref:uncharacterized protein n=1 Tax=Notamacropus eugenii TaxID=9315 RepID=UPI003B67ABB4